MDRRNNPHNLNLRKFVNEVLAGPKAKFTKSERNQMNGNPNRNPSVFTIKIGDVDIVTSPVIMNVNVESRKKWETGKTKFIPELQF